MWARIRIASTAAPWSIIFRARSWLRSRDHFMGMDVGAHCVGKEFRPAVVWAVSCFFGSAEKQIAAGPVAVVFHEVLHEVPT
jgi:hypothetical protein